MNRVHPHTMGYVVVAMDFMLKAKPLKSMVNSHKRLMCGHLVLQCGKSSPLQRNSHTVTCQISRSLRMHSKARIIASC